MSSQDPATTPLYVRLPSHQAELLSRAAFERGVSKREIVTSALEAHLRASKPPEPGPLVVEPGPLTVGRHRFLAAELPEVLTLTQAAELLQVSEDGLAAMAEAGELPRRRVAGEWRFSHAALLAWLAEAG